MIDKGESPAVHLIHMLSERGGFDGWWDDVDDETQNEIIDAMNERIGESLRLILSS